MSSSTARSSTLALHQLKRINAHPHRRVSANEPLPRCSFSEKERHERQHWIDLKRQLIANQLKLTTGPIQGHVQFSNYCNLSCIMCWNGKNPRTRRVPANLLERIESQLGPHLSVIVPFSGSEPLILSWEATRRLAERYGVLLRITTNMQFLDQAKFEELKDITETLCVSVDCHIPEVLQKIRQRSRTDTVLRNLATTARLSREAGIECIANVVLLTYNAPFLPDTVRYLHSVGIENVDVIQMVDINHESYFYDPLTHYSSEFLDWIRQETIAVCRETKMRLLWNVGLNQEHDFREAPVPANPRKVSNDHNDWLLKHYLPGFCKHAYNRLRLDIDGDVAPCYFATEGQLSLGNLNDSDMRGIWNGPNAQDLRRGMYTDDVPTLCQQCRVRNPLPAKAAGKDMEFTGIVKETNARFFRRGVDPKCHLHIVGPEHNKRCESVPVIELKAEPGKGKLLFAMALGGSRDQIETTRIRGQWTEDNLLRFQIPLSFWRRMRPNLGYWWTVWQHGGRGNPVVAGDEIRCLIRHQPMPRIPGSTLEYSDEGRASATNLGAAKTVGFTRGIQ